MCVCVLAFDYTIDSAPGFCVCARQTTAEWTLIWCRSVSVVCAFTIRAASVAKVYVRLVRACKKSLNHRVSRLCTVLCIMSFMCVCVWYIVCVRRDMLHGRQHAGAVKNCLNTHTRPVSGLFRVVFARYRVSRARAPFVQ